MPKGLWLISFAFLTLTIAHTPQRELEPHIYDTPMHHIHTHFVYEYNTYYCPDVTCTLDILDIPQYDYCLFVCITACIHCTSLEWPTVTNDTPPHTLYSWLFGWCMNWQFEWYAKRRSVHHTWNYWLPCKPQWPGSKERRWLLDGTIVNWELLYAYIGIGIDVSTVRFVCVHNTSRQLNHLQLYCKFRYRTLRRHIN